MQDVVFLIAYIGFMCILTVVTVAIMNSLREPRQNFYIATYGDTVHADVEDDHSPAVDDEDLSSDDDDDSLPDLEEIPGDNDEDNTETTEENDDS